MNKLLKLGVVLFGLALAFIAYTDEAKADGLLLEEANVPVEELVVLLPEEPP